MNGTMNNLTWAFTNRPTTKENVVSCVGPGWTSLVENLIDDLLRVGWDGNVFQVKEKFGTLRFYIGKGSDEMFKLIDDAERDSKTTCEVCGVPGKLRIDGWMKVLCDEHGKNRPTEHSSI